MEAALRTAADVLSGRTIDNVKYEAVRGLHGIKESTMMLGPNSEIGLNVAVCHQMRNVREFLAEIEQGKKTYHFIEIMTCPGTSGAYPWSKLLFRPPLIVLDDLHYDVEFFWLVQVDVLEVEVSHRAGMQTFFPSG
jgi:Iron only hydrogenase large subunit, C-terminal domain